MEMQQLPKIVRDRLTKQHAEQHPDADLLTAFAEHAVSGREREHILEHIAHCPSCRHVLSLAAPESTPSMLAVEAVFSTAAKSWRYPLVLRWGALAVSLVLVSAAGMLLYKGKAHRTASVELASAEQRVVSSDRTGSETKSGGAPAARQAPAQGSPKLQFSGSASRKTKEGSKFASMSREAKGLARVPAEAHLFSHNTGVASRSLARGGSNKISSPENENQAAPRASAPSLFSVGAQSKSASQEDSSVASRTVTVEEAATGAPVQSGATESTKTRKATLPSRVGTANAQTGNTIFTETSASVHGPTLMRDWVVPQWALSADGLPQRSFDSGKTWEKVQVDHITGFRALSARGLDVWVGGRAGALYHCTDFGLHWTRVIAVSGGDTLTADIVRIDFSDALHGTVTTSGDQVWTTSDAGKTWQRH